MVERDVLSNTLKATDILTIPTWSLTHPGTRAIPEPGSLMYDTDNSLLYISQGPAIGWASVGSGFPATSLDTPGQPVIVDTVAPTGAGQVLVTTSITNATWQSPPTVPATSLATSTSGSPVVVDTNTPSAAGQILVTTSTTNATWQTGVLSLIGNSGPAITGNDSIVTTNSTIKFSGSGSTLTQNFGGVNLVLGSSLPALTSGTDNVAVGTDAFLSITSGGSNVAMGFGAGFSLLTGSFNTLIGTAAGGNYTGAESNNIQLGDGASGTAGESNVLRIGGGTGTGAGQLNTAIINGIRGITTGQADAIAVLIDSNNQLGTVSSSARFKENIVDAPLDVSDQIMKLRVRNFNYKSDESQRTQWGLVAEEVAEAFPYLVATDQDKQPFSVKYHELPIFLLAEIQNLRREVSRLQKASA